MKKIYFVVSIVICLNISILAQKPSGKWGILTEASDVKGSFIPDTDYAIDFWNTANQGMNNPTTPFEGNSATGFTAMPGQWWGFGFRVLGTPIDMSNYWNGTVHIAIRTTITTHFTIELVSFGTEMYGQFDFVNGSDPQGFKRDGQWHEFNFPLTKAGYHGLDISQMINLFTLKGDANPNGVEIDIDDMYWLPNSSSGISTLEKNNNFRVYPNPVTNNQFSVQSDIHSNLTVEIIDMLGKTIYSKKLTSLDKIIFVVPDKKLTKGIYVLSVKGNAFNYQQKISVE